MIKFQPGDRIRISSNSSWAIGATGTIAQPPEFAVRLVEDEAPWQGQHRFVKGRQEFIEFFWVCFDEPQIDADGDGPYKGGEFEVDTIEPLLLDFLVFDRCCSKRRISSSLYKRVSRLL